MLKLRRARYPMKLLTRFVVLLFAFNVAADLRGADTSYSEPAPPALTLESMTDTNQTLSFDPYPSADIFRMFRRDDFTGESVEDLTGVFSNLTWTAPLAGDAAFHRLEVQPLNSNALLTATVLNRLAYGQTPDLLDRLAIIGPEAYIAEQLQPETITDNAHLAHPNLPLIESRFGGPDQMIEVSGAVTEGPGTGSIADLQAWLVLNAVFADRQLLEVMTQFWENHFVTLASKSVMFFNGVRYPFVFRDRAAAEFEWREVSRWRQAMLNPTATFLDMLTISAESPAMLVYLDTYASRGDGRRIPNENYSRELLELFCNGVDNGYEQIDITRQAACWTGWTLDLVAPSDVGNPFAPRSTELISPTGGGAFTNLAGVWTLNFKPNLHAQYAKVLFEGKTVPARFGEPYTTKLYGGNVTPGLYQVSIPARTGTNGFRDGYEVIQRIANLPFTQEHISVKLCRLFVHEEFDIGYDFTSPDLSEEGQLVRACMNAWENSNPRGQLRPILETIFSSALFRGHGANAHKVKTPLEYTASAVRVLRQSIDGSGRHGTWFSTTDGYGITSSLGGGNRRGLGAALLRMGDMSLFNRDDPDGYPEGGFGWISAGTLAERLRFVGSLLKAGNGKTDGNDLLANNLTFPVHLLETRMPDVADREDPVKVINLFLGLIYPGEGRASLDAYRNLALAYLNTEDDGVTPSPFADLTPSHSASSVYDQRVRGMISLLMSLQRFHEQ